MKIEVDKKALIGAMACEMMFLHDYLNFSDEHSKLLRLRMMQASFEKVANLLGILSDVKCVYGSLTGKRLDGMFEGLGEFNDDENQIVSGFKKVQSN